jgi:nicotinate-nucleotide--dimethylbenzimidazole phosphoribosyltransferase
MMLPTIPPIDPDQSAGLRVLIDGKAKPLGALGRVETLAIQLGLIVGHAAPKTDRALLLVFAGDHGLTQAGVSSYPAAVTQAMVATFLAGKASANAFARAAGADLRVVDAGVDADLPSHHNLVAAKVRRGTRNAAEESALTLAELETAIEAGVRIAGEAFDEGYDTLLLGEMGIGNTASASLIMHRLAPAPLDECLGVGAGHDAEGLARKRTAVERAAGRSDATGPLDVLREFGGLEIAMMVGAVLGSAARRRPVLIDGFIGSAAALAAIRLEPAARDYCVFTHCSAERGHGRMLAALDAEPLLRLEMRLGEGTGALLALPLVRAAARLLADVASLEDVLAGRL